MISDLPARNISRRLPTCGSSYILLLIREIDRVFGYGYYPYLFLYLLGSSSPQWCCGAQLIERNHKIPDYRASPAKGFCCISTRTSGLHIIAP